jgi:hypothetical protein
MVKVGGREFSTVSRPKQPNGEGAIGGSRQDTVTGSPALQVAGVTWNEGSVDDSCVRNRLDNLVFFSAVDDDSPDVFVTTNEYSSVDVTSWRFMGLASGSELCVSPASRGNELSVSARRLVVVFSISSK